MSRDAMKRVELQLVQTIGATGIAGNSYALTVPLLVTGAIDTAQWPALRDDCRATRRGPDAREFTTPVQLLGQTSLVADFSHCDGAGTPHTQFYFDRLHQGSHISIRESDGLLRTFCIATITSTSGAHGFITHT